MQFDPIADCTLPIFVPESFNALRKFWREIHDTCGNLVLLSFSIVEPLQIWIHGAKSFFVLRGELAHDPKDVAFQQSSKWLSRITVHEQSFLKTKSERGSLF